MKLEQVPGRDPNLDYLHVVNDMLKERQPANFASFLLKHGQQWTPAALPPTIKRMTMKLCFFNAAKLAMKHKELTYVEGFGNCIIPVQHAWCVDAKGNVIDPTWEKPEEATYFGIPFKTDFLKKFLLRSKVYGLLDRWDIGFPIQSGKYQEQEWRAEHPATKAPPITIS